MVRLHSFPLHGLRTSRYRGDGAVCCPSGRLGIAPNIGSSVVKWLCRPSPVFPRFRANGSHRSVVTRTPSPRTHDLKTTHLRLGGGIIRCRRTPRGDKHVRGSSVVNGDTFGERKLRGKWTIDQRLQLKDVACRRWRALQNLLLKLDLECRHLALFSAKHSDVLNRGIIR